MEIRRMLRGENTSFASSVRPAQKEANRNSGAVRPSADRVELSRQWLKAAGEQRLQTQAAVSDGKKQSSILDMLDGPDGGSEGGILGYMQTEKDKLDGLSEELDVQMKCMKIAANIMKGKRVPPEDERYLMEHDPDGYKLAIAMRSMAEEDDEECESVLKDEDKKGEETSDSDPADSGDSPDGGEAAASVE